jgi:hypothetical protein
MPAHQEGQGTLPTISDAGQPSEQIRWRTRAPLPAAVSAASDRRYVPFTVYRQAGADRASDAGTEPAGRAVGH